MTPEEKIANLERELEELKIIVLAVIQRNSIVLEKDVVISAQNGIRIGTTTGGKIGFFNATPVAQQATIADPSGGATVDTQARTAINSILDVLDALGFTA